MSAPYTHRNGETEHPTIEGKFEFFGTRYGHHVGAKNYPVTVASFATLTGLTGPSGAVLGVIDGTFNGFDIYEGRWWGPVE